MSAAMSTHEINALRALRYARIAYCTPCCDLQIIRVSPSLGDTILIVYFVDSV